ncbi:MULTISPECIES: class I SAM-dependent methyltransferase [Streptomyces]|nr:MULTISPECIES: class I SAM-dependent methyltransferase [Streptomyces]KFG03904.1 SAM-dependent methyltransferase [Streptomyces scabiei]MDW8470408.1 class I SAM-dependent methyltransferase [Streptomyces scabiei]MDX2533183.1 class I SAM-dependent methyltransferase [Streptomyces scabiei]MDX2568059.1 class I SAM-dependent methyltransferase [Streptomyces scabiei]MDX2627989.1 class I SAM-dependent methyltransferase [Streptomyces scabiei]
MTGMHADHRWSASMPAAYERHLVPVVFRPFAEDLTGRAAALHSRRNLRHVLELAAGTGVLTSRLLAAVPSADVTATDLNEAMVALGSARAPGAVWRQADAQRLPFPDDDFDLVVCQFGVMFFPDRVAAYTEIRRVLAPGGRFLFNTWGPLATHTFEVALQAGLERALPADPPRFFPTVPHGYADPAVVVADLVAAGFTVEEKQELTLQGRAESVADLATGYLTGTPVCAAVAGRGDSEAVRATVVEEMTARLGPGPVTAPMTAYVFRAAA